MDKINKALKQPLTMFEDFNSLKKSINKLAESYELSCLRVVDLGEVKDEDYEEDI